ncbi:MAG: peptidoglycan DD-metalloendopeptidase family protein [Lachnospiraceae bacterium]
MKERHKRKEVYSVIFVSHTDNQSRQFTISALWLRLSIVLLLFICGGLAFGGYRLAFNSYREHELQQQVNQQTEEVEKMSAQIQELNETVEALRQENQVLLQSTESSEDKEEAATSVDLALPRLYPSDGVGDLKSTFTVESPYLTIGMRKGDNVVATGDGTVSLIDYDLNYLHSVEIKHESGYISRYFCNDNVEIKVKEGDQVKARDPLFTIIIDYSQLDYQIILDNEAVNPFQVMKVEE